MKTSLKNIFVESDLETFKSILQETRCNQQLRDFLTRKDEEGYTGSMLAIKKNRADIVATILDFIANDHDLLTTVLIQIKSYHYDALMLAIENDFPAGIIDKLVRGLTRSEQKRASRMALLYGYLKTGKQLRSKNWQQKNEKTITNNTSIVLTPQCPTVWNENIQAALAIQKMTYTSYNGATKYGKDLQLKPSGGCSGLTYAYLYLCMLGCESYHHEIIRYINDPSEPPVVPIRLSLEIILEYLDFVDILQKNQSINARRNCSIDIIPEVFERVLLSVKQSDYQALSDEEKINYFARCFSDAVKSHDFKYLAISYLCVKEISAFHVVGAHLKSNDIWEFYDSNAKKIVEFHSLYKIIKYIIAARIPCPPKAEDHFPLHIGRMSIWGGKTTPQIEARKKFIKTLEDDQKLSCALNKQEYLSAILEDPETKKSKNLCCI